MPPSRVEIMASAPAPVFAVTGTSLIIVADIIWGGS